LRRTPIAQLYFLALLGAACHPDRRPPMHPENPPGAWYTVSPGETLEQIAARAGVPPEDILEINGLSRASDVRPGKIIYVLAGPGPISSPPGAAPGIAPPPANEGLAPPPAILPPPSLASVAIAPGPGRFRWPIDRAAVGSPFGTRAGRQHEGIDLPAPIGTPVYAAADGQVVYAGSGIRGYGNLIVIQHEGDLLTVYAHNSELLVARGDKVRVGQRIALSGQSGHASGPHLHFEVRSGQIPVDPVSYLSSFPSSSGGPP
jgi:murein DD-endopeptidase MepM/ murein hydrolase activator NlpD